MTLYDEFAPELQKLNVPNDLIRRFLYRIYVKAYEGYLADAVMRKV